MRARLTMLILLLACLTTTGSPAPAADAGLIPPMVVVAVTCWEGDLEVVYEAIAFTPPNFRVGAWQITLTNHERVITSAPCKVVL